MSKRNWEEVLALMRVTRFVVTRKAALLMLVIFGTMGMFRLVFGVWLIEPSPEVVGLVFIVLLIGSFLSLVWDIALAVVRNWDSIMRGR